jgi:hypothetical protein
MSGETEQEKFDGRSHKDETSTPKPDPTALTSEALKDAIGSLRTLIDQRINSATELFDTKIQLGREGGMALKELFEQRAELSMKMLDERYATQCVSADTPILCTDLIWRPAGDLLVGDELIGFDEEPSLNHGGGHRSVRRFRRSVVTANTVKRDSLLLVTTTLGSVRCNRDHPFLARHDKRGWKWVRAEDLTPGIMLMSVCDVWEQDRSFEGGWLSGFIDGEGCLSVGGKSNEGRARFTINQAVGPTADRMVDMFKERFPHIKVTENNVTKYAKPGHVWRPIVQMQMDRRIDIMRLLGSVRPQRLLARSDQVWEDFPLRGTERRAVVTDVEVVGTGLIASLSTSTKTYVAQGFAVHNTKALDAAFLAQQAAMTTAFSAAEKAVQAALLAAEKAVEKANVASEKRFEGVNEFRAQLSDIINTMMPRSETTTMVHSLDEKISDMKSSIDKGFTGVDVRHDTGTENRLAYRDTRVDQRANIAIMIAAASSILSIVAMIVISLLHHSGH